MEHAQAFLFAVQREPYRTRESRVWAHQPEQSRGWYADRQGGTPRIFQVSKATVPQSSVREVGMSKDRVWPTFLQRGEINMANLAEVSYCSDEGAGTGETANDRPCVDATLEARMIEAVG